MRAVEFQAWYTDGSVHTSFPLPQEGVVCINFTNEYGTFRIFEKEHYYHVPEDGMFGATDSDSAAEQQLKRGRWVGRGGECESYARYQEIMKESK